MALQTIGCHLHLCQSFFAVRLQQCRTDAPDPLRGCE
jgi:hypothetical protein